MMMAYWEPPYPIMSDDMVDEPFEGDPDEWHDQRQFDRAVKELGL